MLILFDVDGTITESGKKITNDMISTLIKVKNEKKCLMGIVGGGNMKKILFQLDGSSHIFDYIFSECGAVIYKKQKEFECIYKKSMMEQINNVEKEELDGLIKIFRNIIVENNILSKGNNIDIRNGLIYFSFPGMEADDEIRNKFFELNKKRELIKNSLDKLKKESKYFIVAKGGEAGFSITLPGWDKSQVISTLSNILGEERDIYFFGDKCDIDGNDYPLYIHKKVKGICVKNYLDTIEKLKLI